MRLPGAWRSGAETVWLPTGTEVAALDRDAVTRGATTERALIECAGRELAHRVAAYWPEGPVTALVGSGHNGADALVALRTLHAWGRPVRAVQAGSEPPDPDVLVDRDLPLEPADAFLACPPGAGVILDGILGTGIRGAPRPPQARLIEAINGLGLPVIAVDGPSGANLDDGAVAGACVRASLTVTLGWPKLGMLRSPARERCGAIEAVEIGFPPFRKPPAARAITGRSVARQLVPRAADAHKGDAGFVVIVAGQEGMAGASILAARAAIRGGAGVIRVVGDPANRLAVQAAEPGALFVSWSDDDARREALHWAHVVAVGPGLGRGEARRELVRRVLAERQDRPAVVDADGLSVFAGAPDALAEQLRPQDVLTPHPGELGRLLDVPAAGIAAEPFGRAREAADRFGCTVVLKGAPTVVASPDGSLQVATVGGPALAAGGSGDVLTGALAALLAAGLPGADAAAAALFLTGLAAESSDLPAGHAAADVPDRLPGARAAVEALGPAPVGSVRFALSDPDRPGGGLA
ncbi:MAG: NAD(P)H-hydrate dehydratase [Gemmatimonadota bacterium]|nr:NAD(P)H-hydrate dehydratase [Gemmatimonadota bacterium]